MSNITGLRISVGRDLQAQDDLILIIADETEKLMLSLQLKPHVAKSLADELNIVVEEILR